MPDSEAEDACVGTASWHPVASRAKCGSYELAAHTHASACQRVTYMPGRKHRKPCRRHHTAPPPHRPAATLSPARHSDRHRTAPASAAAAAPSQLAHHTSQRLTSLPTYAASATQPMCSRPNPAPAKPRQPPTHFRPCTPPPGPLCTGMCSKRHLALQYCTALPARLGSSLAPYRPLLRPQAAHFAVLPVLHVSACPAH
jgi:hypothetical protein